MTSEGQHAGRQAEATSGAGGTEQPATAPVYGTPRTTGGFRPDAADGGFPPDPADRPSSGSAATPPAATHPGAAPQPAAPQPAAPQPAAPQTAWGPDAYPDSYGPPSYPASGGSPFVVPAVPVFGTPQRDLHRDPHPPVPSGSGDVGPPAPHPDAAFRPVHPAAGPVAKPLFGSAAPPEQGGTSGADQGRAIPPEAWAPMAADPSRPARPVDSGRAAVSGSPVDSGRAAVSGAPVESGPFAGPSDPHPYRPAQPPVDQRPVPAAATGTPHPYRDDAGAHPYRGSGAVSGSAAVPAMAPQVPFRPGTGQAPATTPDSPAQSNPVSGARPAAGGPLPSRADRPPFGGPDGPGNPDATSGFNGFATSSGTRQPDQPRGEPAASGESRPAGISAFGGQRVRVPGAALTGLPDAPPAIQAGRPADGGGFHLRGGAEASEGQAARQTPNGLPVRGSGTQPSFPAHGGTGFASARGQVSGAFTPRGHDSGAFPPDAQDPDGPNPPGRDSGAFAPARQDPDAFAPARQDPDAFTAPRQDPDAFAPRGHDSGAIAHGAQDSARFGAGGVAAVQAVAAPGSPVFDSVPADASAVPQPRNPADPQVGPPTPAPAVGTARPVFASASVPATSRATRPADLQELPPPGPSPQPRVYGRSAPPADPGTPNPAVPAGGAPQPISPDGPPPAGFRSAQPEPDHRHTSQVANGQPTSGPEMNGPAMNGPAMNGPEMNGPAVTGPGANDQIGNGREVGRQDEPGAEVSLQEASGRDANGLGGAAYPGYGPRGAQRGAATGRASASARVVPPADAQPFSPGSPSPFRAAPSDVARSDVARSDVARSDVARSDVARSDVAQSSASPFDASPSDAAPADRGVMPFGSTPADRDDMPFGAAPADRGVIPFGEPTTDVARRGRNVAPPPEHAGGPASAAAPWAKPSQDGGDGSAAPYSEPTSDLAGRAPAVKQPYVPAPALPSMHAAPPGVDGFPPAVPPDQHSGRRPGRPQLSGLFPPANRATVTPPGPAETSSWLAPADNTEQSRFEAFKPEETAAVPAPEKPEPPHVRMLPVLIGVVLAAALLVGVAIGVVWLIARPGDSGFDVKAGDCVRRDGDKAVTAPCGQPGSFQVVSTVDRKEQCTDPGQPYVENPAGDGRLQVLCLKPSN